MCRPNLERTVAAVVLSLLVAGLLLVGTVPASAQSKPNGQGIPQQISALEQQIAAISLQLDTLGGQLSGLTPGGGSAKVLRVVDANGTEVGPMISRSEVVRKLGDVWLTLSVGPSGFVQSVPLFYNTNSDCSGTRYMVDSTDLIKQAYAVGARVYYGDSNPQEVQVAAYEYVSAGDSTCYKIDTPFTAPFGRVVFSVLPAFSAPFTVRYDQ